VSEHLQLVGSLQSGVEGQSLLAVQLLQQLQSLHVLLAVSGVSGVVSVGVGAAVQVVYQSAGALVAALAAAVNDGGGHNLAAVAQGLQSLHEVIGGPGTGLLINVLQSAGLLEQ